MKTWLWMQLEWLLRGVTARFAGYAPAPEKKGLPTWAIILIVVGGVLVLICLIVVCVIVLLPLLLGPAIENIFENIIYEI